GVFSRRELRQSALDVFPNGDAHDLPSQPARLSVGGDGGRAFDPLSPGATLPRSARGVRSVTGSGARPGSVPCGGGRSSNGVHERGALRLFSVLKKSTGQVGPHPTSRPRRARGRIHGLFGGRASLAPCPTPKRRHPIPRSANRCELASSPTCPTTTSCVVWGKPSSAATTRWCAKKVGASSQVPPMKRFARPPKISSGAWSRTH